MTPEQELILAAARVARASPESWDAFVRAHHAFEWDLAQKVVIAPPNDILHVAQGRAQGVAGVGRMLEDCRRTASSIEDNRKKEGS